MATNKEAKENRYGVHFSQLHAIDLIDMNGDGLKDMVFGRCVGTDVWMNPRGGPAPSLGERPPNVRRHKAGPCERPVAGPAKKFRGRV